MRKWSDKSLKVRATLDKRLKKIVDDILHYTDVSLVTGYRNRIDQDTAFRNGHSQLQYPQSKHNKYPAVAVDIAPWPYPEKDTELWGQLGYIAGVAIMCAERYGVELRWGGDWNQNGTVTDNNFDDLFHFEIVEPPD